MRPRHMPAPFPVLRSSAGHSGSAAGRPSHSQRCGSQTHPTRPTLLLLLRLGVTFGFAACSLPLRMLVEDGTRRFTTGNAANCFDPFITICLSAAAAASQLPSSLGKAPREGTPTSPVLCSQALSRECLPLFNKVKSTHARAAGSGNLNPTTSTLVLTGSASRRSRPFANRFCTRWQLATAMIAVASSSRANFALEVPGPQT